MAILQTLINKGDEVNMVSFTYSIINEKYVAFVKTDRYFKN